MTDPTNEYLADGSEPRFRSRDRFTRFDPAKIEELIASLRRHYDETDPERGEPSREGKDAAAFFTLMLAGKLVDEVAGWAVDHAMGKAAVGQGWVGSYPPTVKEYPEYLKLREEADSHDHERVGSKLCDDFGASSLDPKIACQALQNLVRANSGGFPWRLGLMTDEALTALSYGEVLPIIQPNTNVKRRARYRELRAQLRALEHVEYRAGTGKTKTFAEHEVADAYGVGRATLKTWGMRTREKLGTLKVAARLHDARAQARSKGMDRSFIAIGLELFGADALAKDAALYWEILKEKEKE